MRNQAPVSGISLFAVKADRAQDFEQFCTGVVETAIAQARPQLQDHWQLLRPEHSGRGANWYAIIFHGDVPDDDWDLPSLLQDAYGDDAGSRHMDQWNEFMVEEQRDYNFAGTVNS